MEAKSVEDLLKPRYKVIAGWPNMSGYKVGETIEVIITNLYDPYPHLFKRLEWWEERSAFDLPVYVKCRFHACSNDTFYEENGIYETYKVVNILKEGWFQPATETEYQTFIKNKSL